MTAPAKTKTTAPGVIEASACYTLQEFSQRMRLGDWALRRCRRAGLRVHRVGNVAYVTGRAWLDFLESDGAKRTEAES
jgi:hypothetical protein